MSSLCLCEPVCLGCSIATKLAISIVLMNFLVNLAGIASVILKYHTVVGKVCCFVSLAGGLPSVMNQGVMGRPVASGRINNLRPTHSAPSNALL